MYSGIWVMELVTDKFLTAAPGSGKGGDLVKITGTRRSGTGPGVRVCRVCFCLSR